jgi:FK506-binding nuclear protein
MEVDSEEEAPKLVKAKKGSKKRAADDSEEEEDVLAKILKADAPAANGEKLTKSQKKKLKNNAGKATDAPEAAAGAEKKADAAAAKKDTPVKAAKEQANGSDKKKVQFAEKLVQDQPSTKSEPKADAKADKKTDSKEKKTFKVGGITVDERKAGNGRQAKAGDKIGMRYIGKLKDGKIFDCELHIFARIFMHDH